MSGPGPGKMRQISELIDSGRPELAQKLCGEILRAHPQHGETLYLLGAALQSLGRPREAIQRFMQATSADATKPHYFASFAFAMSTVGLRKEAVEVLLMALSLHPDSPDIYSNLGNILRSMGRLDEAVEKQRRAVELAPESAEIWANYSVAQFANKNCEEALRAAKRAVSIKPEHPELLYNLGNVLLEMRRFEEAEQAYLLALEKSPRHVGALVNLGESLKTRGKVAEAIAQFRQALKIDPTHADGHWNLAIALLTLGQFEEGWREYEWRRRIPSIKMRQFPETSWDGAPLGGKTLLIHAEQGLGDTIQFIRYARLAKDMGARVVFECPAALCRLLESCEGIDELVPLGQPLPRFDVHTPLLTMPLLCGTTFEGVPAAIPYLTAEREIVEAWRPRFDPSVFSIGICWQGNPTYKADAMRSLPVEVFLPLARTEGVRIYALQKQHGRENLAALVSEAPSGRVEDLGAGLDERTGAFVDTAAVMMHMDLVVCSDTAVAHLAGALGRPVWMLTAAIPDWRWAPGGERSPWYPTMRLFRQTESGDWQAPMNAVCLELAERMAEKIGAQP